MPKRARPIGEVRSVEDSVACMIMNPGECPVVRRKTAFDVKDSAVCSLQSLINLSYTPIAPTNGQGRWGTGASFNGAQIQATNGAFDTDRAYFQFRDLMRHFIYYAPNPAASVGTGTGAAGMVSWYSWVFDTNGSTTTPGLRNGQTYLRPLYAVPNAGTGWSPHGPKLYAGESVKSLLPLRGLWVDSGITDGTSALSVTVAGGTFGATPDVIMIYAYQKGRWNEVNRAEISANGTSTFAVAGSGGNSAYFAVGYVMSPTSSGNPTVAVDQKSYCDCWAHITADQFNANLPFIYNAKMYGCSFRLQNIGAEMYKTGTAIAIQADASEDWYDSYASVMANLTTLAGNPGQVGGSLYNELSEDPGSVENPLTTGIYGYLKPNDLVNFEPITKYKMGTSGPEDIYFDLDNNGSDFMVFVTTANPTAAGGTSVSLQLTGHVHYNIEYYTHNKFITMIPPTITQSVWDKGVEMVAGAPQFFDNPDHWGDIWRWVKKTAGKVWDRYGPRVIRFADYMVDRGLRKLEAQ